MADIINTLGNSTCTDSNGKSYWQDTAVFIAWDDWGGWWDHVNQDKSSKGPGVQDNCTQWGCGYVYGFRVPLLVVSGYTPAGYVSGALPSPGEVPKYMHDFGGILAFIENNFLGSDKIGQINPGYPFADAFAPDSGNGNIPLSDFFNQITQPRQFEPITLPPPWQSYGAIDPAGSLYGIAGGGAGTCGGGGCGLVYKLTPAAGGKWTYKILHRFTGSDGALPVAGPTLDGKGNLYGPRRSAAYGAGVVFEITP